MNLKQLIEEAYLDMGADVQEGGSGDKPEWLSEVEGLVASLRETLRALECHLDDDTNAHGLKSRDILCPCNENEVARAKAILAKVAA